jgi:hypothetical protein
MAQKPETVFRRRVRMHLDWLSAKFKGRLWYEAVQQKAIKGSPDFVLCAGGQFIALELKSDGGIISLIQEAKMNRILEAGGLALVADPDNWETVLSTIAFYLEGDENEIKGNRHDS